MAARKNASWRYEKRLWRKGFQFVAGVDEVGRGPLAGPLVAAAVIFPQNCTISGLNDSKKLTPHKREELYLQIKKKAIIGLGKVSPQQIDKLNIASANLLAMRKAVISLKVKPHYLLIDGARNKITGDFSQQSISGGDRYCASIAAASIIAKVTRDRLMIRYHKKYPAYRFQRHKGYGTAEHFKKISLYGPCPIHRKSFFPMRSLVKTQETT